MKIVCFVIFFVTIYWLLGIDAIIMSFDVQIVNKCYFEYFEYFVTKFEGGRPAHFCFVRSPIFLTVANR